MKLRKDSLIRCGLVTSIVLASTSSAQEKGKYSCSEADPQSICNAANTCGSISNPCTIDIKRTAASASITPSIPNIKSNSPFCVKSGTRVTWKSKAKDTGFLVDFGPSSPFESGGAIIGGSDQSRSAVAKKQGCYKFSVGVCVSGSTYGMCDSVDTELVVTAGN